MDDGSYSYVYSGQWGKLDHIFINEEAYLKLGGVEAALWHCNADELDYIDYNLNYGRDEAIYDPSIPERFSDHDPAVLAFNWTCADGKGEFYAFGDDTGRSCDWLALRSPKKKVNMCSKVEGKGGLPVAQDLCRKTCRMCPNCIDGLGKFAFDRKGKISKLNCANLNIRSPLFKSMLCGLTEGKGGFPTPQDMCPVSCGLCPNSCIDKVTAEARFFFAPKNTAKSCQWLWRRRDDLKDKICAEMEGTNGYPAAREICPHTCNTCHSD